MNKTGLAWEEMNQLMNEMVEEQKERLLKFGRTIIPTLTPEDMLQPNDYLELEHNPYFRYEEGVLAGLQSMHIALRALQISSPSTNVPVPLPVPGLKCDNSNLD